MNKTVIIFMGKSGSGKSTLENMLVAYRPNLFHRVVSVTTRAPREGEVNGREYYFIDQNEWTKLDDADKLIQKTWFGENYYGSTLSEYNTDHPYATLTVVPSSGKTFGAILKHRGYNVVYVYFDLSEKLLYKNMTRRGDTPAAIEARLSVDNLDQEFKSTGITPDYVVTDRDLNDTLQVRFLRWLIPEEGKLKVTTTGREG